MRRSSTLVAGYFRSPSYPAVRGSASFNVTRYQPSSYDTSSPRPHHGIVSASGDPAAGSVRSPHNESWAGRRRSKSNKCTPLSRRRTKWSGGAPAIFSARSRGFVVSPAGFEPGPTIKSSCCFTG